MVASFGAAPLGAAPHASVLFLLAEVLELGVDHITLGILTARSAIGSCRPATGLGLCLGFAIHDLGELVRCLGQLLLRPLDSVEIVTLEGFPRFVHGRFDAL